MFRYNQWAVDEIIQMLMCYAVTSMQCMSALVFALGELLQDLIELQAPAWLICQPKNDCITLLLQEDLGPHEVNPKI